MISQANIKWISQVSGVAVEEISGALSNEKEVTLDLRLSGRVISQEDEKALKENAVQQGKEIGFKDVAKESGITLDSGEKDAKIIAEKLKTTIITSLEDKYKNPKPGEKEIELTAKLEAEQLKYNKLFETHEGTKKIIEEKQKEYLGLQKDIKTKERNNSILKSLPEKIKQDRNDALIIFNSTYEFDEVDGQQVIKRGGQVVTDSVGKPEKLENIVPSFAEEKNWLKGAGMGGSDRGGNNGSKGGKTPDEATKIIKEKYGDNFTSQKAMGEYRELTAKVE